jgi:hypothetical protein
MHKLVKRVRKLFADRKTWVRLIVVSAVASGVAWQLGDLLIKDGGVVAAIICALSIRISLYKSIREGFGQIVGTAIGACVALACVTIFDFGIISVAMTVLLCSVVARALHLGEVASVNVPVTALIVIGPGLSESTAFSRLSSTLIGAAVAIVFSYFSHAKTPAGRTVDKISSLANKCAKLLGEMSEGVAAGYTQDQAGNWLAKARLLVEEIPGVRAQSQEARGYAKWFPTAQVDEAEELYVRGVAVEHTVVQVRTIARTLFDSSPSPSINWGFRYLYNSSGSISLDWETGILTGSLFGTASYATQALSASYATQALSASYATTALSSSFAATAPERPWCPSARWCRDFGPIHPGSCQCPCRRWSASIPPRWR